MFEKIRKALGKFIEENETAHFLENQKEAISLVTNFMQKNPEELRIYKDIQDQDERHKFLYTILRGMDTPFLYTSSRPIVNEDMFEIVDSLPIENQKK